MTKEQKVLNILQDVKSQLKFSGISLEQIEDGNSRWKMTNVKSEYQEEFTVSLDRIDTCFMISFIKKVPFLFFLCSTYDTEDNDVVDKIVKNLKSQEEGKIL